MAKPDSVQASEATLRPARAADDREKSQPAKIGYARVSLLDDTPRLQIDALEAAGCERIFVETKSSLSADSRPQYHAMMSTVRPGDIVIVWTLDRLGRNTPEVLATFAELTHQNVQIRVLTQREVDTTTPAGHLVITIMAAVAQSERAFTRERTKAGVDTARQAGRFSGRRSKISDATLEAAYTAFGATEAGRTLQLSRVQVIKRMNRIRKRRDADAAFNREDATDP